MVGTDGCHAVEVEVMGAGDIQREILPIPDRPHVGLTTALALDTRARSAGRSSSSRIMQCRSVC